jgi:hypothetical protein
MSLETNASKLAAEYLRLGGVRKVVADDNELSTRIWGNEPPEAAAFWEANVNTLAPKERAEVESFLPSISEL